MSRVNDPILDDPDLEALVHYGVDAAKQDGAEYVDVRVSHERAREIRGPKVFGTAYSQGLVVDRERLAVGIRVAISGYWGFASGPLWHRDELARMAKTAVLQAKTNALGKPRAMTLAPTPVVERGTWTMPVRIDPFDVPVMEIMDFLGGLGVYVQRTPRASLLYNGCAFTTQHKAFGSSDGSYYTQRTYESSGGLVVRLYKATGNEFRDEAVDLLTPAGVGWELYHDQPLRGAIDECLEEIRFDLSLPHKPVDVGRFDAVLDAKSLSHLVSQTIGMATELDRALGYEANAGGTSYLTDLGTMLGTFKVGAPLLGVTGNRNEVGGAATVRWDDEGVVPEEFPVVEQGIVTGMSTTRESATWLPGLGTGTAIQSHGCAYAPSALALPMPFAPNLVMAPGTASLDFDGLVTAMGKGVAFKTMGWNIDFQQVNGLGRGKAYEVKGGKRTALLDSAGILFRTPELWKSLSAIGGATSARRYGILLSKGEPPQRGVHSVTTVPALFKEATVIDALRKA